MLINLLQLESKPNNLSPLDATSKNTYYTNTNTNIHTTGTTSYFSNELIHLAHLLKSQPYNVTLLNAYGIELAKLGDLISAIKVWRYAIDINPHYVHLYNNIGSALRRLGYKKEAGEWYKASLKVHPTYWTWYNLGLLEEDNNNIQEAIKAYNEALKLFPGFTEAFERLSFLQHSKIIAKTIKESNSSSAKPKLNYENQTVSKQSETTTIAISTITQNESNETTKNLKSIQHLGTNITNKAYSKLYTQQHNSREYITFKRHENLQEYKSDEKKLFKDKTPLGKCTHLTKSTSLEHNLTLVTPYDKGGQVFITFDGGADNDGALPILAELAKRNIKATFFLTGEWVLRYSDIAKQIIQEGHEIANHSMRHKNMANWNKSQIKQELEEAEQVFIKVLGKRGAPFFRFPFGAQNTRVESIVEELGYKPVYWHIDTLDWKEPPVHTIVNKVVSKVRRGAVILMHLGSINGAKALPQILDFLIANGYKPDKLSNFNPNLLVSLPTISNHKLQF